MLTLILLVVLGGGAAVTAVWLIDARGLSSLVDRSGWRSLRRPRAGDTTRSHALETPAHTAGSGAELAPGSLWEVQERTQELPPPAGPAPGPTPAVAYVPLEVPFEPLPRESARRDGKRVPAAYTAIEGSYRDVARTPLWRKVTSLVSLVGVLVLVAAVATAIIGAAIGLLAELVDGAIG